MVFVFGLVLVDVTILVIYTVLEGVIAHFEAGAEKNKEKPIVVEGVSKTYDHINCYSILDHVTTPRVCMYRVLFQDLEIKIEYFIYTCSVNTWIRLSSVGILHLYKGILQVCALVFAFQTRKVKIEGLNDAKYITAFVYTTSIIVGMTFIASLALADYINIYAVVYSFGVWLAISAVLGFLFVPKVCACTACNFCMSHDSSVAIIT